MILNKILTSLLVVVSASSVVFAQDKPLKQDGKETLYQRVLSTPTCLLVDDVGLSNGKKIPTFSRYYVYERQNVANKEWLKVGPDEFGKTVGWLASDCAVPWNIQMTLAFTNKLNRESMLFFKDEESLSKIISSDKRIEDARQLYANVAKPDDAPEILSKEPDESVDFRKDFYLLPILQGKEEMNASGLYERLLEVASVSKKEVIASGSGAADGNNSKSGGGGQKGAESGEVTGFKAAVVFVIDSTISMDPYINRTREAVKKLYEKVERANLLEQVKFGLVAFRSSTDAVPGLEYTSKMFVNPNNVKDGKDFMNKISALKQAKVSSKEFSEDAYAGVQQALSEVDWNKFGGRYIVLVTDAGAIDGDNPLSTTGLGAKQLRQEAQEKGVAIYSLHLKTPSGRKNHQGAEEQYKALSFNKVLEKPLYYDVNAGDVKEFGEKVDVLSEALISQVQLAYRGEKSAGSALSAEEKLTPKESKSAAHQQIQEDAELLGKAMQLAYRSRTGGQVAPPVFRAWVSDMDLVNPQTRAAEVRVLLTKSQLSELSDVVKGVADAATTGAINPNEMFAQLRSIAAAMGQDPSKIKQGTSTKIAELGLLGEYLDGIPYKSQISGMTQESWESLGAQEQDKFIRDLRQKLNHYKLYNDDVNRWIPLAEGSDVKDYVYPVELDVLP